MYGTRNILLIFPENVSDKIKILPKDPDGSGVGAAPVEVFCDMKTGTTRIDHQLMEQVLSIVRQPSFRWSGSAVSSNSSDQFSGNTP
jgi:hypothetical protein